MNPSPSPSNNHAVLPLPPSSITKRSHDLVICTVAAYMLFHCLPPLSPNNDVVPLLCPLSDSPAVLLLLMQPKTKWSRRLATVRKSRVLVTSILQ